MSTFKKQYRDLEMRVMNELRDIVEQSGYKHKNYLAKAIKINPSIEEYNELALINNNLCFLDDNGDQYSVFNLSLEVLIDIVNQHRPKL